MKYKIVLLSFVTILFCSYNAQINKDEIIGKWKVVEFNSNTPTFSSVFMNLVKAEFLSRYYSFDNNNNTISIKSNIISNEAVGKYEFISKNIIKISYTLKGKDALEEYQLELLNGNLMKWTEDLGDHGSLSMTLKKE